MSATDHRASPAATATVGGRAGQRGQRGETVHAKRIGHARDSGGHLKRSPCSNTRDVEELQGWCEAFRLVQYTIAVY
jgi:hypothetical protein